MHARLAEALARIGAAVLVGVSENHHAARLATLVEHADDHVSVAAYRDVSRQSSAVGENRRAETLGQLDRLVTPTARRISRVAASDGSGKRNCKERSWRAEHCDAGALQEVCEGLSRKCG